jgi:hypothetical protein
MYLSGSDNRHNTGAPMQIDTSLAIIIVAVLIFYLRLIVLQRERAKRVKQQALTSRQSKAKDPKKTSALGYSILSQNKHDWVIAGIGIALIIIGILLNVKIIPVSLAQTYWWLPVAIGIIAFSWGFK